MAADTYLVADLFCGAGGSSTGAKKAIAEIGGTMELVAVNHWNTAIATHAANHPTARHLVEDVSMVDPEAVVEEGRLDLLMASPECKFYSRARGGKPIHDQGRMNPWAIHNWLTKLDVKCVLIENVPEFVEWGPLKPDGLPDRAHKGEHFQAWFLTFHALGYKAEWRMLNAADYGDATTRIRFFLMARKDETPVVWPEPSHVKGDTGMFPGRHPWRGAREIIDWSNPGRSLLDDPKYRKKPLSEKTRLRIARGLERFGGPLAPLYIQLLDLPAVNQTFPPGAPGGMGHPFILNRNGENGATRAPSVEAPVPTVMSRGGGYLVVQSFMLGQQSGGAPRSTSDPAPTVTGDGAISLVQPAIVEYYGRSNARDVDEPLSSVTTRSRHGLVNPTLVEVNHGNGAEGLEANNRRTRSVDEPLGTLTSKRGIGLAQPVLVQTSQTGGNGIYARPTDQPIPTLTTINDMCLATPTVKPYIVPNFGERDGQEPRVHDVDEPVPAVTSRGAGSLVSPMLVEPILKQVRDANVDPRRVVFVDGHPYLLDIRFRMLQNPELARAMGFEDDETSYEFIGNVTEVTKQIGNAVPVHLAAALVKAVLGQEMNR